MRLTKTTVDGITPPDKGQAFYRDDKLKGFGLRVTPTGAKSFVVETRVKGRTRRETLGRYGPLTVEQARREAQKYLGQVATGIDPRAWVREVSARNVTLKGVFEDYCIERKSLKPSTLHDYRRIVFGDLKDWLNRPIGQISKDAVAARHRRLGERSHARANNAMRVLRALFNFARGQYEDAEGRSLFLENPVSRLSHTRSWYPNVRRRTVISRTQLAPWLEAVTALKSASSDEQAATVADYLLLLLFTGLRRTEGMTLQWQDVDLEERTLLITDTKNKEPLNLPLSDFVYDLLKGRQEVAVTPYIFPGAGEHGHLIEPRKQMRKVIKTSGVNFTLHDLRRTFITAAESLDISMYAIKRLVNHKMSGDVTAGYIVPDAERLRVPMQQITDYLLSTGDMNNRSKIISLHRIRTGELERVGAV
jgi:integrase